MQKKTAYILASYLGLGYSPKAPGTVGSFFTLPLAFFCAYQWGAPGVWAQAAIAFIIGVSASQEVLKYTEHDPSLIVIDEVVGQALTFLPIANDLANNAHLWPFYLIGFAFFRLFDIWKPQPVRWVDCKILNAWGVMLDDVFAGVYAAICLFIVMLIWGLFQEPV